MPALNKATAFSAERLSIAAIIGRIPDTSISDRVRLVLSGVAELGEAVGRMIDEGDPLKSAAGLALVINAEKDRLRTRIDTARSNLMPLIENWRAAQENARVARANLQPSPHAVEIRAVFRSLAWNEKLVFMADAAQANDGALTAAIVSVPAILSGLTVQQQEHFRDLFLNRAAGPSSDDTADELVSAVTVALSCATTIATPALSTAGHRELPKPLIESAQRADAAAKQPVVFERMSEF